MEENLKWLWYVFSLACAIHLLYVVSVGRRVVRDLSTV